MSMPVVHFPQCCRDKLLQSCDVANVEHAFEVILTMKFQQQEILFHLWNLYSAVGMCQGVC